MASRLVIMFRNFLLADRWTRPEEGRQLPHRLSQIVQGKRNHVLLCTWIRRRTGGNIRRGWIEKGRRLGQYLQCCPTFRAAQACLYGCLLGVAQSFSKFQVRNLAGQIRVALAAATFQPLLQLGERDTPRGGVGSIVEIRLIVISRLCADRQPRLFYPPSEGAGLVPRFFF